MEEGGTTGAAARIRIRGSNSINLSNDPLLIVDGVRVNNLSTALSISLAGQSISRMDDLNGDDIESIEVIKGPSAATLYGTEASNGVIQIITKRGAAATKPQLDVSLRTGTNWLMNPAGRAGMNWYRANLPPGRLLATPRALPPVQAPTLGIFGTRDLYLAEEPMLRSAEHVRRSICEASSVAPLPSEGRLRVTSRIAPERLTRMSSGSFGPL